MTSPEESSATSETQDHAPQLDVESMNSISVIPLKTGPYSWRLNQASNAAEAAARRSFGEELLLSDTEQLVGVGPSLLDHRAPCWACSSS
jgi:hypothetical protein